MNEHQDQVTWFDLYGYDGFQWEFIASFDDHRAAQIYDLESEVMATYEDSRIRRRKGLA